MVIRTGDELIFAMKNYMDKGIPRKRIRFFVMITLYTIFFAFIVWLLLDLLTAKTMTGRVLEFLGIMGAGILLLGFIALLSEGIVLIPFIPLVNIPFSKGYLNYSKTRRLLENSKCYFSVNKQEKYFVSEYYVPSRDLIYNGNMAKDIIRTVILDCLPHLKKHQFYIEIYAIAENSIVSDSTPLNDIEEVITNELNQTASLLPTEIINKGIEMSKVYITLYCLENVLRMFIDKTSKNIHGDGYMNIIHVNNSIQRKINDRKAKENNYKYISLRGSSDLYYMDFKELGDMIINNQFLLDYFPSQIWIKSKIDELGNIRNLIAHNSYVGKDEINIIKVHFRSISKQIGIS